MQNLGERFNSPLLDGPATISSDGKYIFFTASLDARNGDTDVYWVSAEVLEEYRPEGF